MNVRFNILPYALLRGEKLAKRIRRGRLVRICGQWFWK